MRLIIGVAVALALSACGNAYLEQYRQRTLDQATQHLMAGDEYEAYATLTPNLGVPETEKPYMALLKNHPGFDQKFRVSISRKLDEIGQTGIVPAQFESNLKHASKIGFLTQAETDQYLAAIEPNIAKAVAVGEAKIGFGPQTQKYPLLLQEPAVGKIIANTLAALPQEKRPGIRRDSVMQLFLWLKNNTSAIQYKAAVKNALPTIPFGVEELKVDVASVFPKEADVQLAATVKKVAVRSENRLIEIDVGDLLKKRDTAVEITTVNPAYTVQVTQLAFDERQKSTPPQTVTIGYYQADAIYAALFMPKNSSFLYEVTETSVSVDWGYEVRVIGKAGERSKILRDSYEAKSVACSNPRVMNVFGGVSSPNGWPNQWAANQCNQEKRLRTPKDIKEDAFDKVADTIIELMN